MISQILNFGLPAPINVQVVGRSWPRTGSSQKACCENQTGPGRGGLAHSGTLQPARLQVDIDRTRAAQVGFTPRDVAGDLLVSLSGSFQTSPTFWLDPKNGRELQHYGANTAVSEDSLQDLENIPITNSSGAPPQILGNLASISRGASLAAVSHYNVQPVINIYGTVQGRDLGGMARDIDRVVDESQKDLPRGSRTIVRGQIATMRSSFAGLLRGTGVFNCACLSADCCEFPILAGPFHHHFRLAGSAGRNSLDAVRDRTPPSVCRR